MKTNQWAPLAVCMVMLLAAFTGVFFPAMAMAAGEIKVVADSGPFDIINDQVLVTLTITNNTAAQVTIGSVARSTSLGSSVNYTVTPSAFNLDIAAGKSADITVLLSGFGSIAADVRFTTGLLVTASAPSAYSGECAFYLTKPASPTPDVSSTPTPEIPTPPPPPTPNPRALFLDTVDKSGNRIAAPHGNYGESVRIILPLKARVPIYDIEIAPVMSAKLDEFPFDISSQNYTRTIANMLPGSKVDVVFNFTISKLATSGVKAISFAAKYYEYGAVSEAKFTVYLTVVKGATETLTPGSSPLPVTVPKVIISSYSLDPEQVYAGEEFDLNLSFKNTSDEFDVKNVKITLKSEDGTIIPASSGSNTLYTKSIGKQQEYAHTLRLKSQPDAAVKSYPLAVSIEYENPDAVEFTATETLAIPILQRIRVVLDEPQMYGDVMVGSPANVSCNLINMGKSTLYNCMFTVEGEGMHVEESYFAGNVASGSSTRADLNVIPEVAGQLPAKLVVTFEDAYGNQTREERDLTVSAMDMDAMRPMPGEGGMVDPETGLPLDPETGLPIKAEGSGGLGIWLYVIIAVVLAVVALIVVLRLKRKARLTKEFDI